MDLVNCPRCGIAVDRSFCREERTKAKFGSSTQYVKRCPVCKTILGARFADTAEKDAASVKPEELSNDQVSDLAASRTTVDDIANPV